MNITEERLSPSQTASERQRIQKSIPKHDPNPNPDARSRAPTYIHAQIRPTNPLLMRSIPAAWMIEPIDPRVQPLAIVSSKSVRKGYLYVGAHGKLVNSSIRLEHTSPLPCNLIRGVGKPQSIEKSQTSTIDSLDMRVKAVGRGS